jgi:hemoglobin
VPRKAHTKNLTAQSPALALSFFKYDRNLRISPAEFDKVAAELGRTLDFFKIPKREKGEVLAACSHKNDKAACCGHI